MAKLVWDEEGTREFETGVSNAVLYKFDSVNKKYGGSEGYVAPWNGVTGITEAPSGADANNIYADNMKYLVLRAAEDFGCTLTCYTYPNEFAECDGRKNVGGVTFGQQKRSLFGLSFKSKVGNDTDGSDHSEKLHLIYGCTASPSERSYATENESPEAIEFSYEITTTSPAAPADGIKPTAIITIDKSKLSGTDKTATTEATGGFKHYYDLLDKLYGTETATAYLPTPSEVYTLFNPTVTG